MGRSWPIDLRVPTEEVCVPEHRSAQWYGGTDRHAYIHRAYIHRAYIHRAWMRRGLPISAFDGRPHIAIANTASDLTPCNKQLVEVAESVKQGVYEAGGIPLNLPVVSPGRRRSARPPPSSSTESAP